MPVCHTVRVLPSHRLGWGLALPPVARARKTAARGPSLTRLVSCGFSASCCRRGCRSQRAQAYCSRGKGACARSGKLDDRIAPRAPRKSLSGGVGTATPVMDEPWEAQAAQGVVLTRDVLSKVLLTQAGVAGALETLERRLQGEQGGLCCCCCCLQERRGVRA